MAFSQPVRHMVRFGPFELDESAGQLFKSGIPIKLQPQPFRVLFLLIERAGEVVTREEIHKDVWGDTTFVDFERGINFAINQIRGALCDDPEKPRYVETIPRRGYRFISSLEEADGDSLAEKASPAPGAPATSQPRYGALRFTAVGLLLTGVAVFGLDVGGLRSRLMLKLNPPAIHSLAVLPLQNLSGDATQEYFADGMTDGLITNLAEIGSVNVTSRTSSMQYKQTKKSLPEIARELNVEGIVEGTVQRSGDRVRINAQLIYGPSDRHLWAHSYERDVRDVFMLEREVTEDIARQIQARLTTNQGAEKAQLRPMDPKALEAYLQGNYHLNKQGSGSGDEEKRKAAGYFEQAIAADPNFVPAYRGLVLAHKNRLLGSSEDVAIIKQTVEKVAQID
jgi:TolB-like protein/DNA-binding winged helix-turn-helix (wHTH) protein